MASMVIRGSFWDRTPTTPIGIETIPDYYVELKQVPLSESRLFILIDKLKSWLEKPQEIEIDLSPEKFSGENFKIFVGKYDGLITSQDKPACLITYESSHFLCGKWGFILDQSCIRIFAEELEMAMGLLPDTSAKKS